MRVVRGSRGSLGPAKEAWWLKSGLRWERLLAVALVVSLGDDNKFRAKPMDRASQRRGDCTRGQVMKCRFLG